MKNKTLMKTLSAILAVVMVLCSAPLSGLTGLDSTLLVNVKANACTEGNFYYKIDYYLDDNYVKQYYACITGCVDSTGDIIIPEALGGYSVMLIGENSFANDTNLISITIPESIIQINDDAFYGCTNLTNVYYSGDIASWCSIKFGTFSDSNPLDGAENFYINGVLQKDIIIPDTVVDVGGGAFYGYAGLNSVVFSNGVKSINFRAFAKCENLKSVEISDTITLFGRDLFDGCNNIKSFTIGDSCYYIDPEVFNGCGSIDNVYYTGDLQSWCKLHSEPSLLRHAENLYINGTLVVGDFIIDSVGEVSNSSFAYSKISSLYLNNIKLIGVMAFAYCKNLEDVALENIAVISEWMFYGCENLKEIYIPKSVKIINKNAFGDCKNIETVYFEGTEEEWNLIAAYSGNVNLFEAKVVFLNNTGIKPSFVGKGEVSIKDITIDYKETVRLSENFKVNTGDNYKLIYKSSHESIVTVDENGYVTGVGRGSAEITVTLIDAYGNEVSDTAVVTVNTTWWQWLIVIFLFGWIWY
ncbi:MAG: leucine-rich repeat protein [Clostridia bacterium]|nr:leucine-rich repeat protein [Clostridia bacterium]